LAASIVGRTAANRAGICQKLAIPLPAGKTATKINQSYVALDHDHGNSAAYYLLYFHEKRNPPRSWLRPRGLNPSEHALNPSEHALNPMPGISVFQCEQVKTVTGLGQASRQWSPGLGGGSGC
jgi:hypothetical protein